MRYYHPADNGNKYGINVKVGMIHAKPVVLVLRYDSVLVQKRSPHSKLPGNAVLKARHVAVINDLLTGCIMPAISYSTLTM